MGRRALQQINRLSAAIRSKKGLSIVPTMLNQKSLDRLVNHYFNKKSVEEE